MVSWPNGLERHREIASLFHFTDVLPTLASACEIDLPDRLALDGVDQLPILRGEAGRTNPTRFWQWNRYLPTFGYNAAMRDGDWKLVLPSCLECRRMTPEDGALLKQMKASGEYRTTPPPEISYPEPGNAELFNVRDDPCERTNLAQQESGRTSSMYSELERWFHTVESERRARQ